MGGGFGSCHSLVSQWVCAAVACAKCAWQFGDRIFLKMRRVGLYFSNLSNVASVSSQRSVSCHEDLHLSPREIFVEKMSPVFVVGIFVRPHCHQRFAATRRWRFGTLNCLYAPNFIKCTIVCIRTSPPLLGRCC